MACTTAARRVADHLRLSIAQVLHTPTITFEIQQLVLNSTSKLLAVVGAHSVVVVVLPRRGWSTAVGKTIECRSVLTNGIWFLLVTSFIASRRGNRPRRHSRKLTILRFRSITATKNSCLPIGAFYHSLPGSPSIASVLWHPLGADASSLLLLTADCTLREYTVSEDVSEPAQVVSFSRSGSDAADKKGKGGGGARFGFSAIEKDAETAAAMCVGQGKADWGPLTLYALMRNGDVVSLCPFLPKKACVLACVRPPSFQFRSLILTALVLQCRLAFLHPRAVCLCLDQGRLPFFLPLILAQHDHHALFELSHAGRGRRSEPARDPRDAVQPPAFVCPVIVSTTLVRDCRYRESNDPEQRLCRF